MVLKSPLWPSGAVEGREPTFPVRLPGVIIRRAERVSILGEEGVDCTCIEVSIWILTKEGALLLIEGTGDLDKDIVPLASIKGLAFDDFLDIDLRIDRKRVPKEEPDVRRPPELVCGRGEPWTTMGDFRVELLSVGLVNERLGTGRSRRCMTGASSKVGGRSGICGTGGTSFAFKTGQSRKLSSNTK